MSIRVPFDFVDCDSGGSVAHGLSDLFEGGGIGF